MKLLSTRARYKLWKLQESVRATHRERDQPLRILTLGRSALMPSAHRDLWMEFCCADQEYRYAVQELEKFCEWHTRVVQE